MAGWTLTLDLCLHFLWVSGPIHKALAAGDRERRARSAGPYMLRCSLGPDHFLSSQPLFAYITATLPRPPTLPPSPCSFSRETPYGFF